MPGKKPSKHNEHFERIDATPEQLAKAVLNTSPQQLKEWRAERKDKTK